MDRNKFIKWLGVLLAVLVVGACSKEEDHEYTKSLEDSFKYYGPNGNYNGVANDGFRTEAGYTGVWSMDDVIVDSADVYFAANGGMYYLDFLWFPYNAITKKIAPDVNVAKIKFLIDDGGHLESQEDQMLADLHSRLGINKETTFPGRYPSNFLRLLGCSEWVYYFELLANYVYSPFLYLPYTVTTDKGEVFGVIAEISYTNSTAMLDLNNDSFTCVLTIPQIEIIRNGEAEMKQQSPELKLKYTSIKRKENVDIGN